MKNSTGDNMDAIVIGRVKEFLEMYRSGSLEKALESLKELMYFVEKLLDITRDNKAQVLALNVYLMLPLYEEVIKLKMKLDEIEKLLNDLC